MRLRLTTERPVRDALAPDFAALAVEARRLEPSAGVQHCIPGEECYETDQ